MHNGTLLTSTGISCFITHLGDKYTGYFHENKYHGKGILKRSNGVIIEGKFQQGDMNDNGSITYSNGDKFQGKIVDNQMSSSGKMIYK